MGLWSVEIEGKKEHFLNGEKFLTYNGAETTFFCLYNSIDNVLLLKRVKPEERLSKIGHLQTGDIWMSTGDLREEQARVVVLSRGCPKNEVSNTIETYHHTLASID